VPTAYCDKEAVVDEMWQAARLIPTTGINGAQEQEGRATSALLAVMSAVREFGRALTQPLGAPAGPVQTFIEVPLTLGEKRLYPDGLIRIVRGKREWTALVEVKTGQNALTAEQLENYLDIAGANGFDVVLSISNEIPPMPGQHPTPLDQRKSPRHKVKLCHLAWSQILTEATVQKEHRGVADPDQAWILGELIRYLEHPKSGALEFNDMGPAWVNVREAVAAGTLRDTDRGLGEVSGRFDALLHHVCLRLGRQLGTQVTIGLSRKELADPALRAQSVAAELVERGRMSAVIRIPGAVNPVRVRADLRAGQITCTVEVDAPQTGKPTTRVNWIVRQLKHAPDTLRLEAQSAYARGNGAAELLRTVRENPAALVTDPRKPPRTFRIAQVTPAGTKRASGNGSFIASVVAAVDRFYEDVVQVLKPPPEPLSRPQPATQPEAGDGAPAAADPSTQDSRGTGLGIDVTDAEPVSAG
jgi:hypothetical protein